MCLLASRDENAHSCRGQIGHCVNELRQSRANMPQGAVHLECLNKIYLTCVFFCTHQSSITKALLSLQTLLNVLVGRLWQTILSS